MIATKKDWRGNKNSIYKILGASSHTDKTRETNDFYATDPEAGKLLLQLENFSQLVWECSCGQGHLSKVLEAAGHTVISTDLINRGFGVAPVDFLAQTESFNGDIITNPPFKHANKFILKALELIPEGRKVAMLLKVQFLEGKERKKLFAAHPPKVVYVSSSRILCAKNADFEGMRKGGGSAVAYAWYIWEKGFKGNTQLAWFN